VDAIWNPHRKRSTMWEMLRLNIRAAKVALCNSPGILIMHYLHSVHEMNAYRSGCVCLFAWFILKTSGWILMKFHMVIMPLEATPNSNFNISPSSLLALQPCVVLAYSMVLWKFHNSKFLWVEVISSMPNPQPGRPGTTLHLAPILWSVWHRLPYTPASLALCVMGRANLFTIWQ
jgi:hypothetical protein